VHHRSVRDDGPRAAGARRPSGWIDKTPVVSRHFRIATANPLATEAGHDILRNGGNAIDAAVVVQLVLGLVEPQSSGLGGCSFMLYHGARSHRLFAYGLAPYA
jgi:gamma-glutamyltranspeptidase/glutathione hydrolase